MNYYPHHIGDFRSGTINMTRLERWIYRDLLDIYYDTEKLLPLDHETVCDLVGARSDEECKIVAYLLRAKFKKQEDGYWHERCDTEIRAYHAKADTARNNGKHGGRPPKPKTGSEPAGNQGGFDMEPSGLPIATGLKANQEPITKNQEPGKEQAPQKPPAEPKADKARGSRLPADWKPTAEDVAYCKAERPDLLPSRVAQNFYDYWIAKPGKDGVKLNWSATWRSWVRKEDARAAGRPAGNVTNFPGKSVAEQNEANAAEAKRLLFGKREDDDDQEQLSHA